MEEKLTVLYPGMYDAIRIADVKIDYGRMTPLSEAALEDNGASQNGSQSLNFDSAFGSADNFATSIADIYYKISDQQDQCFKSQRRAEEISGKKRPSPARPEKIPDQNGPARRDKKI